MSFTLRHSPGMTADSSGPVFRQAGGGERLSWRAEMLIKASGFETRGAFSLIETVNPPDAGPPLHVHRAVDEAFYVLAGDYEFHCGEQRFEAGPGAFVLLPRGLPPRYRSGADGGRVLMLFTPGGTEAYFRDVAEVMSREGSDDQVLAELARQHGIELLDAY